MLTFGFDRITKPKRKPKKKRRERDPPGCFFLISFFFLLDGHYFEPPTHTHTDTHSTLTDTTGRMQNHWECFETLAQISFLFSFCYFNFQTKKRIGERRWNVNCSSVFRVSVCVEHQVGIREMTIPFFLLLLLLIPPSLSLCAGRINTAPAPMGSLRHTYWRGPTHTHTGAYVIVKRQRWPNEL